MSANGTTDRDDSQTLSAATEENEDIFMQMALMNDLNEESQEAGAAGTGIGSLEVAGPPEKKRRITKPKTAPKNVPKPKVPPKKKQAAVKQGPGRSKNPNIDATGTAAIGVEESLTRSHENREVGTIATGDMPAIATEETVNQVRQQNSHSSATQANPHNNFDQHQFPQPPTPQTTRVHGPTHQLGYGYNIPGYLQFPNGFQWHGPNPTPGSSTHMAAPATHAAQQPFPVGAPYQMINIPSPGYPWNAAAAQHYIQPGTGIEGNTRPHQNAAPINIDVAAPSTSTTEQRRSAGAGGLAGRAPNPQPNPIRTTGARPGTEARPNVNVDAEDEASEPADNEFLAQAINILQTSGEEPTDAAVFVDELAPLGATVSAEIRNKIKKNEFIVLDCLLPNSNTNNVAFSAFGTSEQFDRIMITSQKSKIKDFNTWLKAFTTYASILTEFHPSEAAGVLKHINTVHRLAELNANWLGYDTDFRRIRSNNVLPFVRHVQSLYLRAMEQAAKPMNKPYSAKAQVMNSAKSNQRRGYCFKYNSHNDYCQFGNNCSYRHRCSHCDGTHSAKSCSQLKGTNANQRR